MRSRRGPSRSGYRGVAPIAGAREAAQRATARASTPRKNLTQNFM
jgi:hypothetical protein